MWVHPFSKKTKRLSRSVIRGSWRLGGVPQDLCPVAAEAVHLSEAVKRERHEYGLVRFFDLPGCRILFTSLGVSEQNVPALGMKIEPTLVK